MNKADIGNDCVQSPAPSGPLKFAAEHVLAVTNRPHRLSPWPGSSCRAGARRGRDSVAGPGRYPGATRLMTVCEYSYGYTVRIIERAQQFGALRPDFTPEDLLLVLGANAQLARAAAGPAPDVWRRGIAFTLDGLRTAAAHPLPTPPLTSQQLYEVMGRLADTP